MLHWTQWCAVVCAGMHDLCVGTQGVCVGMQAETVSHCKFVGMGIKSFSILVAGVYPTLLGYIPYPSGSCTCYPDKILCQILVCSSPNKVAHIVRIQKLFPTKHLGTFRRVKLLLIINILNSWHTMARSVKQINMKLVNATMEWKHFF